MPPWPGPPVRTATVTRSARHAGRDEGLRAVRRRSDRRRAPRACARLATSLPPPGSVIASAAIFSPRSTGGTKRCFCASVPRAQDRRQRDAVAAEAHARAHRAAREDQLLGRDERVREVAARRRRTPRGSRRRARPPRAACA
ncbi:MAG: hypothetical protein V9F00_02520 [Nocardioides sp.]